MIIFYTILVIIDIICIFLIGYMSGWNKAYKFIIQHWTESNRARFRLWTDFQKVTTDLQKVTKERDELKKQINHTS